MRLHHKAVQVFADYHQFYLWDKGMNPLAPEDYTKEDTERRIKTGPHVVVVQPESDGTVPVEIEIRDAEPPYEAEKWDHIAEASLHLPTGQLQVHECTGGPVAEFQVAKGWYRARSFHAGLNSVYDGSESGDCYRVVLWPAAEGGVVVFKQYVPQK